MKKTAEKKPLISLGKAKENVAMLAAQNDAQPAEKPAQKRLNVNIDAALHSRFKKTVTNKDQDMTNVVTALLEQWLKDNE
uniref:plasmid partition protein ParG n=1 Tax=Pseudomonas sp. TaxID=306 RepID=UPI0010B61A8D|nr:plasmid partition protein ParG [Pseudomonas sp.]QBM91820.1 partitioning protein ParG [Pseudomonas sp.]